MKLLPVVVVLVGTMISSPFVHADTIAQFDLDARNDFNLQELVLDAGQYSISLRNGAFTAWSNFDTTSDGCTDDCLQGWLNFFSIYNVHTGEGVYVENGNGTPHMDYDFGSRLAYSTPEAALAAAQPFHFLLDSPATVQVSVPDCLGCFTDNRGGLSFTVALVPEPSSAIPVLLAIIGVRRSRRSSNSDKKTAKVASLSNAA
jgi:hypothetical protein